MSFVDGFGRVVRKVRLSVTDRCNFRCLYCLPEEPTWLPRAELLTFEEMGKAWSSAWLRCRGSRAWP